MGIKKREEGNSPSNTLYASNILGVKPAIVLNIHCDHVALIGMSTAAKSKDLETQETLNPYCKFKSLEISLCLITGRADL